LANIKSHTALRSLIFLQLGDFKRFELVKKAVNLSLFR